MGLYAIGDFHLSLSAEKPMDVFGDKWKNHTEKIIEGFSNLNEDDVCVICGDLSWGMSLPGCLEDFRFIDRLPGKKIILKGNHDYWWSTATKAKSFFAENNINSIEILHNNSYIYDDFALCGTRGWFYEEETGSSHDKKILAREVTRLKTSLDSALAEDKVVFLHYPPIYADYRCDELISLLKEYGIRKCYYGHIHGKSSVCAVNGWQEGIEFRLVAADYLNFRPVRVDANC